jgi:putative ABC transport system permease protein
MMGALVLARFGEALLYQVSPRDPVSYLTASIALTMVGLLGSCIPAWRATRVDPLVVLRYQ